MVRDLASWIESYVLQCFARCTPPRVDELARLLNMHPSLLSRTFAADTGLHLSSVIKKRQVEEAKHLLRTTSWNTRMIANRAGFGTINTLFRLFRKYVGMTPQEYPRRYARCSHRTDVRQMRNSRFFP